MPRADERAARRLRRGVAGDEVPDLERRGAWFAEDWPDVPEFALYRDLLLLFRLLSEPVPHETGDSGATQSSWPAALAVPRLRFLHLDFGKKNVRAGLG